MHSFSRKAIAAMLSVGFASGVCFAEDTQNDDFEAGKNDGTWGFILGADVIETSGGNPGSWLHQPSLSSFAPILTGTTGPYVGDYRAMGVTSIEVDARTDYADFGVAFYPFALLLRDTKGTPNDADDDDYAYYVHADECPQVGAGWEHYRFEIPSQDTSSLPAGWTGGHSGDLEQFRPGVDWNDVITNVDQVEFWWIHPAWFAIFQTFDVGTDNVQIGTAHSGGLQLTSSSSSVSAGDTLTLTTCTGQAGGLAMLAVVGVDGMPFFQRMETSTFDAQGNYISASTVPAGLAGVVVDLQVYGVMPAGSVGASNTVSVTLQ